MYKSSFSFHSRSPPLESEPSAVMTFLLFSFPVHSLLRCRRSFLQCAAEVKGTASPPSAKTRDWFFMVQHVTDLLVSEVTAASTLVAYDLFGIRLR